MKAIKIFNVLGCVAVAATLLMLAGCASPENRIKRNPEAFSALSPGDQELVKQGKVALGFSEDAVRLAVGEPDRIWTRTDASGKKLMWTYATYEDAYGHPLYTGWYHRYYSGPFYYPYYLDTPARRVRDEMRITFEDGKVAVVEVDDAR